MRDARDAVERRVRGRADGEVLHVEPQAPVREERHRVAAVQHGAEERQVGLEGQEAHELRGDVARDVEASEAPEREVRDSCVAGGDLAARGARDEAAAAGVRHEDDGRVELQRPGARVVEHRVRGAADDELLGLESVQEWCSDASCGSI